MLFKRTASFLDQGLIPQHCIENLGSNPGDTAKKGSVSLPYKFSLYLKPSVYVYVYLDPHAMVHPTLRWSLITIVVLIPC